MCVVIYYLVLPHPMIMAIKQLHWLEVLQTWYISLLNQAGKGRVFYSVDKCFETGADPCNIFDKQILKVWMLHDLARDFGVKFESLCHHEIFKISTCADKNTIGSHLK